MTTTDLLLMAAFLAVAALYGAVGHGGASGYLAVMAFAGMSTDMMRPTALTLNLLVSALGTACFLRAGWFRWRLFLPFAVTAVPAAYLGGALVLPPGPYRAILAVALAFAASRLVFAPKPEGALRAPAWPFAGALGAAIGLVSGLIGIGGGVFLTPLLLLFRWADVKTAAAVSAPFILVNSAAGLLGAKAAQAHLPGAWPWYAVAVVAGGALGAGWGSGRAAPQSLRHVLAAVLAFACLKLVVSIG